MSKELQFQLWQECNSHCKFCYLGKNKTHTPDKIKIISLQKAFQKISDINNYPQYDTISYLGGEFFQGQLNTPEIRSLFFKLMQKTAQLYNSGIIKNVWIYATMTIGQQEDLYKCIDMFNDKKNFWILTSYDTWGRFHTEKMLDSWKYHMKHIHELYPEIKFNITTILSDDCITRYLDNTLSFKEMMQQYHAVFFFKQCGVFQDGNKQKTIQKYPEFFPTRQKFIIFLKKFRTQQDENMWSRLFNIKYRADTLYRNFNDTNHQMVQNIRHKDSVNQIECQNIQEMKKNSCGHLMHYAAYSDCEGCVMCDKEMIGNLI